MKKYLRAAIYMRCSPVMWDAGGWDEIQYADIPKHIMDRITERSHEFAYGAKFDLKMSASGFRKRLEACNKAVIDSAVSEFKQIKRLNRRHAKTIRSPKKGA